MKANIKEHIEQLDAAHGGAIISDQNRIETISNPILVIGLGGTGLDALRRVKYLVNQKFKKDENDKFAQKPKNIEFLGFETNTYEKATPYKGITLDPDKEFVDLSNHTMGSFLQAKRNMPDYIKEWLDPNLTSVEGVNGAGGVRQAGRLLLFTQADKVISLLDKKITTLLQRSENNKLIVFILGGVSGGTGSGLFLDIPYIIRSIVESKSAGASLDKLNILGYLFTPDVNITKVDGNDNYKEIIKRNGYAALKELDYWMNTHERGEFFEQRYTANFKVQSNLPPYDVCHLISAINKEGNLLDNPYDYCLNVAAENVTNFMANEKRDSDQDFAIHDYMSNVAESVKGMHKFYKANYKYGIIGAASANLPIEEIVLYLAYALFKRMEKLFVKSPSRENIEEFAEKNLELSIHSLEREFRFKEPSGYENRDDLDYASVKNGIIKIEEILEDEFVKPARRHYEKVSIDLFETSKKKIKRSLETVFLNPHYGPVYTSMMIYNNSGIHLLDHIDELIVEVGKQIDEETHNARLQNGAAARALNALKSSYKLLGGEGKKKAFIEKHVRLAKTNSRIQRLERIRAFYYEIKEFLRNQNNTMYNVITEVLDGLNGILRKRADIIVQGEERADGSGNTTYFWNIVEVPEFVKKIDKIIEQRNESDLIENFTNYLFNNMNQWINEDDLDIITSVADFLNKEFGRLINQKMEEFLSMVYGEEKSIDQQVNRVIAPRLNADAVPVFNLKYKTNYSFPSHTIVSVPRDSILIRKGIAEYKDGSNNTNNRFAIHNSDLAYRIFWLNVQYGIPLYQYNNLTQYEETYEKMFNNAGLHLRKTPEEDWSYLPSPIPEDSWDHYENKRLKAYNDEIRQLFLNALEYGVILDLGENTLPRYAIRFIKDYGEEWTSLSQTMNIVAESYEALKDQLEKLTEFKNKILTSAEYEQDRKVLFDSEDIHTGQISLIRSNPTLRDALKQEIEKIKPIYETLKALTGKLESLEQIQQAFDSERISIRDWSPLFLKALYTNTIVKKGFVYVYDKDVQEDDWDPFVNLIDQSDYIEYTIYSKIRQLDDKKLDTLKRKVENREKVMLMNSEQLISTLQSMQQAFEKAKLELDHKRKEVKNGEVMYIFYQEMYSKVKSILEQLRVSNL